MKPKFLFFSILVAFCLFTCGKSSSPAPDNNTNNNGGTDNGGGSSQEALAITDFSPKTGKPNTTITITGKGFGNSASTVQVAVGNSAYDHPLSVTPTSITIQTNRATPTGKISVLINGAKVISSDNFTALLADVTVGSISPLEVKLGEQMYIHGDGFGDDTNKVMISFGGTKAVKANYSLPNTSYAGTVTGALVPRYAQEGKVTVTVNGHSFTSDQSYTFKMSMRDFAPKSFSFKDTVKITGVQFTNVSDMAAFFSPGIVTRPIKVTSTEMLVIVPWDAVSGYLEISGNAGTDRDTYYDSKFTVIDLVSFNGSITPKSGKVGDVIKINGDFKDADLKTIGVSFGGSKPVQPSSVSGYDISVKVPTDAKTGYITITRTGYKSLTGDFMFTITR